MGASTLRRRLTQDGTSLREVLADARMQVARGLLGTGEANVHRRGRSGRLRVALSFHPPLPQRLRQCTQRLFGRAALAAA